MTLHAEQTLRDALAGMPVMARGLTYVPDELLATVMHTAQADALVEACSTMELDFAFVCGGDVGSGERARSLVSVGVAPFWSISGPLGTLAEKLGWRQVLMDTIESPGALGSALDDATRLACEAVDTAAQAGAFAVVVAEDLAGSDGMMLSPDWVIDELAPRLSRIARCAEDRGLIAVFHSDGDIRSVLGSVRRAGFVAIHTGGDGWSAFERNYAAARDAGLAVVGGLEGEALRGGEMAAIGVGVRAAVIASGRGLLIADDGGLTTVKEVAALVPAMGAAKGRGQALQGEDG